MHRTRCTNSAPLPHASSEPLPLPIAAPFTQCTRTLSLSPGHAVCVLQVSIAVRCRAGERCTRSPSPPRALPTWRARRRRARSRSLASCQSDCVALASRCAVLSTRLLDFADCTHISYTIFRFRTAPPKDESCRGAFRPDGPTPGTHRPPQRLACHPRVRSGPCHVGRCITYTSYVLRSRTRFVASHAPRAPLTHRESVPESMKPNTDYSPHLVTPLFRVSRLGPAAPRVWASDICTCSRHLMSRRECQPGCPQH